MKTPLGFAALVLYTFSMLAWGHIDTAQLCQRITPSLQHAPLRCPAPVPARDVSAPALK
jgi:hypothetical protein